MSSKPLLLEGGVDRRDQTIATLRQQLVDLTDQLTEAQTELERLRSFSINGRRAVDNLRRQLSPLYKALRDVMEEMEDVSPSDAESKAPVPDRKRAVWDSWKSRFPSSAKIIDALMLHGEMTTQQLAIAVGLHRTTIPAHIYKLKQAGLINKNGDKFSLKEI